MFLDCLMWCTRDTEFGLFIPFHAQGVVGAFFICHSAPALSTVAIWVRSLLFKAATIPASSAPFMHGFVDAVPPEFTVVISLDQVVLQSYTVTDKAISQNVRLLDCICKTCQTCQNCDNCCCSTRLQT